MAAVMEEIRSRVMFPKVGRFLDGRHKGVRFTASAVYKNWADDPEEHAVSLGDEIDYDDAITYLAKAKQSPAKGKVTGRHHPDQLFWSTEVWQDIRAFDLIKEKASNGLLLRIETDCSIMPCGEFANDSCFLEVPKYIIKTFPSDVAYGICQYSHAVPMHNKKQGQLVTIGDSTSNEDAWAQAYNNAIARRWADE